MEMLLSTRVYDVKRPSPVKFLRATNTMADVVLMLRQHNVLSFPVLDDDDDCLGLVDGLDVVRFLRNHLSSSDITEVCQTSVEHFINASQVNPYIPIFSTSSLHAVITILAPGCHRTVAFESEGSYALYCVFSESDLVAHLHQFISDARTIKSSGGADSAAPTTTLASAHSRRGAGSKAAASDSDSDSDNGDDSRDASADAADDENDVYSRVLRVAALPINCFSSHISRPSHVAYLDDPLVEAAAAIEGYRGQNASGPSGGSASSSGAGASAGTVSTTEGFDFASMLVAVFDRKTGRLAGHLDASALKQTAIDALPAPAPAPAAAAATAATANSNSNAHKHDASVAAAVAAKTSTAAGAPSVLSEESTASGAELLASVGALLGASAAAVTAKAAAAKAAADAADDANYAASAAAVKQSAGAVRAGSLVTSASAAVGAGMDAEASAASVGDFGNVSAAEMSFSSSAPAVAVTATATASAGDSNGSRNSASGLSAHVPAALTGASALTPTVLSPTASGGPGVSVRQYLDQRLELTVGDYLSIFAPSALGGWAVPDTIPFGELLALFKWQRLHHVWAVRGLPGAMPVGDCEPGLMQRGNVLGVVSLNDALRWVARDNLWLRVEQLPVDEMSDDE